MTERRIAVARTARYFTLGALTPSTREVWIVLHGYAQLADHFLRSFRTLDDGSRFIVAPEALSRFYSEGGSGHVGASWMTKVDRESEIEDYVGYLDALADDVLSSLRRDGDAEHEWNETVAVIEAATTSDRTRLVVLGFSQGAATAARWACRGRHRVDALVLWGGMLPPEIDLSRDGDRLSGLVSVLGTHDEYRDDAAMSLERDRLRSAGIPFESIEFDGTHRVETEPLERVAVSICARR
jgi:predicted esterase